MRFEIEKIKDKLVLARSKADKAWHLASDILLSPWSDDALKRIKAMIDAILLCSADIRWLIKDMGVSDLLDVNVDAPTLFMKVRVIEKLAREIRDELVEAMKTVLAHDYDEDAHRIIDYLNRMAFEALRMERSAKDLAKALEKL